MFNKQTRRPSGPVLRDQALLCLGLLLIGDMARAGGGIIPFVNCIDDGGDPNATTLEAVMGYINMGTAQVIPAGSLMNRFTPDPAVRGQPDVFQSGVFASAFRAEFDELGPISWVINGQVASFDRDSLRCDPPVLEDELFEDGFETLDPPS